METKRTIAVQLTLPEIFRLLERRPHFDQHDISAIQKLTAAHAKLAERIHLEKQSGENKDD